MVCEQVDPRKPPNQIEELAGQRAGELDGDALRIECRVRAPNLVRKGHATPNNRDERQVGGDLRDASLAGFYARLGAKLLF